MEEFPTNPSSKFHEIWNDTGSQSALVLMYIQQNKMPAMNMFMKCSELVKSCNAANESDESIATSTGFFLRMMFWNTKPRNINSSTAASLQAYNAEVVENTAVCDWQGDLPDVAAYTIMATETMAKALPVAMSRTAYLSILKPERYHLPCGVMASIRIAGIMNKNTLLP